MKEPVPPCKGCNDRTEGCWGYCPKYLAYKKEHDEYNKVVSQSRIEQYEQNDIIRRRFKKTDKKRQKKERGV